MPTDTCRAALTVVYRATYKMGMKIVRMVSSTCAITNPMVGDTQPRIKKKVTATMKLHAESHSAIDGGRSNGGGFSCFISRTC